MQNAVGIFAAGGLGGALYLQQQERQKLDCEKQASMALQQSQIHGLTSQVCFAPHYVSLVYVNHLVPWILEVQRHMLIGMYHAPWSRSTSGPDYLLLRSTA